MNNRNNDNDLDDLYMMKDKTVEEISECSSGLDDAAKERIAKLCEKKMEISENQASDDKGEKIAEVKKYTSPKWYRAAIASAACLFLVTCVVLIRNNIKPDDRDAPDQVVTSQTEETTENSVTTTNQNPETDKSENNDTQEYQKIVDEMVLKYEEVDNILTDTGEKRAVIDDSDEYSLDGKTYHKVSDPRFSTKQEVYAFVESVYTKPNMEKNLGNSIASMFLEKDGKLYIAEEEYKTVWVFDGWLDEPAKISYPCGNSFTGVKKYKIGDKGTAELKFGFMRENGQWKISEGVYNFEFSHTEFIHYNFNLNVEKISARDMYECSDPYQMPETINGYERYMVEDIRDNKSVYIRLDSPQSNQSQVGIYNFTDNSYSAMADIAMDERVICYTDDYLITENDNSEDYEGSIGCPTYISSISYYDIDKRTSKVIYENIILTDHDFLIYNDCVYFDGYTRYENYNDKDCVVYKYNFITDELTLVSEDALNPVLINNSIAASIINPETGMEETIQIIEGDDNLNYKLEGSYVDLYSLNNGLYEHYSEDGVSSIKELKSQNKIMSNYLNGRSIYISDSNDDFIAFSGESNCPIVYNVKESKMIEFDEVKTSEYNIYVKDNYGVIVCFDRSWNYPYKNKIILFQPKAK